MYANLFTDINYAKIMQRLKTLKADNSRKWGKMSVTEMLRHLRAQIELILNPSDSIKIYPTMYRFKPMKWLALYVIPWPKNSKTAPNLDVTKKLTDISDFETEHQLLLQSLDKLYRTEKVEAIHPLFGKMSKTEWGRAIWKHLDHHLRQFGV